MHKFLNFDTSSLIKIAFVWALVGLGVSAFLWYEYNQPGAITCGLTGNGCNVVRFSPYSSLLGISLPILGFIYFLSIACGCQLYPMLGNKYKRNVLILLLLVAFGGVLFSAYLTYLEVFVIKALCQWCLISALATVMIFSSLLLAFRKQSDQVTINSHSQSHE